MKMLIMRFLFCFLFFFLKIEELKNENALLRAQLQQHGIEMVGETPPQWSRDKEKKKKTGRGTVTDIQPTRWKRRRDDLKKKKKDLWRITFFYSECILPWVPTSWTLHRSIVAVLDCSNPIEITTRYNSVEMLQEKMPTHRCQSASRALAMKENLCWTPSLFCIYVASLMDYDVCHLILFVYFPPNY